MKNKIVSLLNIVDYLESDLVAVYGEVGNVYIDNISDEVNINSNSLDWINSTKRNKQRIAEDSKAVVILADRDVTYTGTLRAQKKVLLIVENPKEVLSKIISTFYIENKVSFVHPSAIIDAEAEIDPTAYIEAGCVIGKAVIGKCTYIKANVVIEDDVIIGDNCVVQPGAVIGTDGLGCSRRIDGILVKFPHLGGVLIGNNVEIGANCQIARGALSDTIISDGSKINGLSFIAHNCHIGKNVWITGNTMLAGSVYVEDNVTIFSKVVIRDKVHIGKNAIVGMGAVVLKDVPEGEVWVGNPARSHQK